MSKCNYTTGIIRQNKNSLEPMSPIEPISYEPSRIFRDTISKTREPSILKDTNNSAELLYLSLTFYSSETGSIGHSTQIWMYSVMLLEVRTTSQVHR